MTDLYKTLDSLIDRWCERRAIKPLGYLLRAYPTAIVHTDDFHDVLDALKDVKGLTREMLTPEELADVISCINTMEEGLRAQR